MFYSLTYLFHILIGDELRWSFTSDSSVNGWGWRFTVYPIMSNYNSLQLGSDRAVLSQPSFDMVMCLLDPRLYVHANNSLMTRLAVSLAACSQLSFLCKYKDGFFPNVITGSRSIKSYGFYTFTLWY